MDLWVLYLLVFVFGITIGSFLNVLIYRLPLSLSLSGRSFCPKCKKKISWYDNIPLVSFILLKGKCRHCHSPISFQYPGVELLTGFLFIVVFLFFSDPNYKLQITNYKLEGLFVLFYGWFLVSALVTVFVIDLKHEIIPDSIVFPAILLTIIFLVINQQPFDYLWLLRASQQSSNLTIQQFNNLAITNNLITNYLPSAFASGFFFLALHLVTRGKGMGFGDVKFAFLMGLVLGFPNILLALYGAFLTGAILGVILILLRRKRFGTHIPFGPFLAFWTLIALFWGEEILGWISARYF